jgi:hypothetical protein
MAKRKGRLQDRGRRVVVWLVGLFVATQLGIGFFLDYFCLGVRFPQAAGHERRWAAMAQPPDIVCLGSSRFGCVIAPDALNDALRSFLGVDVPQVDLATVGGGDPVTGDFLLERLLATSGRPKLIVVELLPELLVTPLVSMDWHVDRLMTWDQLWDSWSEMRKTHCLGTLAGVRLAPLWHYRLNMRREMQREIQPWMDHCFPKQAGAGVRPLTWLAVVEQQWFQKPTAERTQYGVRISEQWLRNYHTGGRSARALEQLLQRCADENIEAILLGPPVAAAHRQLYSPAVQSAYDTYLAHLQRTYPCRFIECRDWLTDDMLLDNHHANKDGAQCFSRLLAERVLGPWWQTHSRTHANLRAREVAKSADVDR